jgi:hypothetical protein
MKDEKESKTVPKALSNPDILKLFREVAMQGRERGWALIFPANMSEMASINTLVECGLITVDSGIRQFDLSGKAKSAEVICELTAAGKTACSALSI